jgi:DNA-binding response OmpR family regulator
MRIVLVEHDDRVREMAVAALRDAGFEVTQAAAREAPTDDAPPVDVRLPDLFDRAENREPSLEPAAAETHLQLEVADPIRVLLVENNEPLREPIAEGLRQAGFEVVEAADGQEAMSHLSERFDVLFTDIDLPGGMDGWTIAERWREADAAVGVIYTSGFCMEHGRQVRGSRCVPKPHRPGQIVAAVVDLANERTLRRPAPDPSGADAARDAGIVSRR